MCRIFLFLCFVSATALPLKATQATVPAALPHSRHFENPCMSLRVLRGWTMAPPNPLNGESCHLSVTKGHYVLAIDPIFGHASPVPGGRFNEIVGGQPSVDAVMGDVDLPAGGFECSLTPMPKIWVNRAITLANLYTDPAKAKGNKYGCHFPTEPSPVWFASFVSGEGPQSDYKITLTYDSADINALPRKDSPELAQVLDQVVGMLRTLVFKPPLEITRIVPSSAPAGATVTVYGHGFTLLGQGPAIFEELRNSASLVTRVAPDGRSLTFVVPASITTMECPPGEIEMNGWCVAAPPGHIDINDCPTSGNQSAQLCSVPTPPATYHVSLWEGGNAVPFTLTASPPTSVSLLLLYPTAYVQPGDFATLRGSGFTPTGNTVHIGATLVQDLRSADGSIRFAVPHVASSGFKAFPVFVSNTKGVSNSLTLTYR